MHATFKTGSFDQFSLNQFLSQLVQSESDDCQNRKIDRNVKLAGFRYKAFMEKIDFSEERSLERNAILRLAQGDYIYQSKDILITGSTVVRKSFLATALTYIDGYRVKYFNTTRLFAQLKIAKTYGTYLKELSKIELFHFIVLDDFGLHPMDQQNRMAFLEIIEDRHGKGFMILTSQLPVSK